MTNVIQEKTNEELDLISSKIIDILEECNTAEKYKILSCLKESLLDTLKDIGDVIEVRKE